MKKITTALVLGLASSVLAHASDDLKSTIRSKAASSQRGVIVALAEPGAEAAETAWLLSQQTRNTGYTPHLLVVDADRRAQLARDLNLPQNAAPTLLIYDRKGREVTRIVGVRPVQVPWQRRSEADAHVAAIAHVRHSPITVD